MTYIKRSWNDTKGREVRVDYNLYETLPDMCESFKEYQAADKWRTRAGFDTIYKPRVDMSSARDADHLDPFTPSTWINKDCPLSQVQGTSPPGMPTMSFDPPIQITPETNIQITEREEGYADQRVWAALEKERKLTARLRQDIDNIDLELANSPRGSATLNAPDPKRPSFYAEDQ